MRDGEDGPPDETDSQEPSGKRSTTRSPTPRLAAGIESEDSEQQNNNAEATGHKVASWADRVELEDDRPHLGATEAHEAQVRRTLALGVTHLHSVLPAHLHNVFPAHLHSVLPAIFTACSLPIFTACSLPIFTTNSLSSQRALHSVLPAHLYRVLPAHLHRVSTLKVPMFDGT
jgi:hypothetical protein